jgi:large subunit ribosomal protein L24
MAIKTNDTVQIMKGKDRGKRGSVIRHDPTSNTVVLEGLNLIQRHTKATNELRQSGIIQREAALKSANVMLVCPHCDRPTRTMISIVEISGKETHVRACKKCQEIIDQPK